jgi:hypothetical protein
MNHTNASTTGQPADLLECITKMKAVIDEFNAAEREVCEQCMLALMKHHGKNPVTHIMFVNNRDVPMYWQQHLPEFVRASADVPSGQAYFIARATLAPFGWPV